MSVVSETIRTKGPEVQYVLCERLGSSINHDNCCPYECLHAGVNAFTCPTRGQVICFIYNYSALLSTSLLPAASPFSASQFLKTYEDEFAEVVNAKQSLFRLRHKGVISQAVKASIEATKDDEDAQYMHGHVEVMLRLETWRK